MSVRITIELSDDDAQYISAASGVLKTEEFVRRAAVDAAWRLVTTTSAEQRRASVPVFGSHVDV